MSYGMSASAVAASGKEKPLLVFRVSRWRLNDDSMYQNFFGLDLLELSVLWMCRFMGRWEWHICQCCRLQILWSGTSYFFAGFKELTYVWLSWHSIRYML